MKKNYILLCIVLLLAVALTGCKKAKEDDSINTAANKGDTAVTATPEPAAVSPTAAPTAAPTATIAPTESVGNSDSTAASLYKDGVYKVKTDLDSEKYYTEATVTIEGGKITSVEWTIYDSGHDNVPFDQDYYTVMQPYGDLYAQQAKDDWSGSRGYTDSLIDSQDIDKVDAVSGATWTNRKFKEIVKMALEEAKSE